MVFLLLMVLGGFTVLGLSMFLMLGGRPTPALEAASKSALIAASQPLEGLSGHGPATDAVRWYRRLYPRFATVDEAGNAAPPVEPGISDKALQGPDRAITSLLPSDAPDALILELVEGEPVTRPETLELGELAPELTLKTWDGKSTVSLADFRGKTPVVVAFGSFTCGIFRSRYQYLDTLHARYGDRVQFLAVYIREAHPSDGPYNEMNERDGILLRQPRDEFERVRVARTCRSKLNMTMPLLVDTMDDRAARAFHVDQTEIFLIGSDGRIVFHGGAGPFGFTPDLMENAIVQTLRDERIRSMGMPHVQRSIPTNSEAWALLPNAKDGQGIPLPAWARALAAVRPRSTASLVELDYRHRTLSPLGLSLAGKVRWVVAHELDCSYNESIAEADLRRAGITEEAIGSLRKGRSIDLSLDEQRVLDLARRLTLSPETVNDLQIARLIPTYGQDRVAALVRLVAFANLQNRLIRALGLANESSAMLPPREIRFVLDDVKPTPISQEHEMAEGQ